MKFINYLTILFFISCSSAQSELKNLEDKATTIENSLSNTKTRVISLDELNGWGVNPESVITGNLSLESLNQDWFYKKFSSKPLSRAVELKSESFIQSSCKKNSFLENSEILILEAFKTSSSTKSDFEIKKEDKENVQVIKCVYLNSNCECILSFNVKGGQEALKKRFN